MIEVDALPERQPFPVLDFKFVNSGHATAIIWKFAVVVEEAIIDRTPVLSGSFTVLDPRQDPVSFPRPAKRYSLEDLLDDDFGMAPSYTGRTLGITVQNDGWGTASNCELVVNGPHLAQLIDVHKRTFLTSIESGSATTLKIDAKAIESDAFARLRQKLASEARRQMEERLSSDFKYWLSSEKRRRQYLAEREDRDTHRNRDGETPAEPSKPEAINIEKAYESFVAEKERKFATRWGPEGKIPLGPIIVDFCVNKMKDSFHIYGDSLTSTYVTKEGFSVEHHPPPAAMILPPDTIYCTIIDADKGRHTREYPISRQVGSGEAERFQIVVGATKSALLRLKLRFYVDQDKMVESKNFPIEIWNPINSYFHDRYIDGDEARIRSENRTQHSDQDMIYGLGRGDQVPAEFPFNRPDRRRGFD